MKRIQNERGMTEILYSTRVECIGAKRNHGEIRGVHHSQLTLPFKTCIHNQPVATWVARSKTRHRSCCTCTYSANDRLTHSQITAWQICTHLSIPVPRSALPIGTGYSRKVQASAEGARSAVRRTRGRSRSTVMLLQHFCNIVATSRVWKQYFTLSMWAEFWIYCVSSMAFQYIQNLVDMEKVKC